MTELDELSADYTALQNVVIVALKGLIQRGILDHDTFTDDVERRQSGLVSEAKRYGLPQSEFEVAMIRTMKQIVASLETPDA